jgi:hypothetical protein
MATALKKPVKRYIVDLAVDPHGLSFSKTPYGAHQTGIEFSLVAYDDDAKRVNYLDPAVQMSLMLRLWPRDFAFALHSICPQVRSPCASWSTTCPRAGTVRSKSR